MRKSTYLKTIEDAIQDKVNYNTNIDYAKRKFFGCFPYPYMNGKLHLGHAFTMLKVDYECRYKKINGYNVLFPFGFHVTGMPIYAASKKLQKEIETNTTISEPNKMSQYDILKSTGIPEDDIANFVNPEKWVEYFPSLGLKHIKELGIMCDTRRSFVTTEINPFYDAFVKWQFTKLHDMGYLKFGTRNSIYSEGLNIQCQDHDRSVGEGIQNSNYKICQINIDSNNSIWIPYQDIFENKDSIVSKINVSKTTKFNKYKEADNIIMMTSYLYDNYNVQVKNTFELIENDISLTKEFAESVGINLVNKYVNNYNSYLGGEIIFDSKDKEQNEKFVKTDIMISLTTDLVIDRLDKVCIVKPVPQWYIDYANLEWKTKAHDCISKMKLHDNVRKSLNKSIDWLQEWGVSRTFGLGTKIPFDENFIIDSLSDSTIYQAYYTFCHLIHDDIYGKVSKYNPADFTVDVFDYIFYGKWSDNIKINKEELDVMKDCFNYFYPVDVRISGKDLIPNHLSMYIFNHCALFSQDKWPISINCNGWILVNGEKMAKSKGNFITIENELKENSVDSVRLTLADSGDNMDDANYVTSKASETNTLKLFTFVEQIEKFISDDKSNYDKVTCEDYDNYLDTIFENIFSKQFMEIKEHYNNSQYKAVVKDVFYVLNTIKEKYRIYCKYFGKKQNYELLKDITIKQLLFMYPITPHISTHLLNKFDVNIDNVNIDNVNINDFKFAFDKEIIENFDRVENVLNYIREKVEKLKRKKKVIKEIVIKNYNFNSKQIKIIMDQIKNEIKFENIDSDKEQIIINID